MKWMAMAGRRALVLASLALVAGTQACSDSGTGPGGGGGGQSQVARVSISREPTAPLEVGDTLTLGATANNAQGAPVSVGVSWSSTNTGVASVTGSGQVRALAPGTAQIIASAGQAADTATVTVQASTSGCRTNGIQMSVGEVRQIDPARDPGVCFPASDAAYTLVAFNGNTGDSELNLTVEAINAAPSLAAALRGLPVLPRRDPAFAGPRLRPDADFEADLRRRERQQLAGILAASRAVPSRAAAAAVPTVGSTIDLNTRASGNLCLSPVVRSGRVAAVTDRSIVVHDPANPSGGFTDEEYRQFGLTFDTLVFRVDSTYFGPPADIDQNEGRIVIFFTRAVNEMTPESSDEYVGGFFSSRDLATREQCAGSNRAEMFYVLAPDPAGEVNRNVRTKQFVQDVTVSTLAHELKHLIGASRRLFVLQNATAFDEVWLEEGVAHIAQELVFYRQSGLEPRQNIEVDHFRGNARRFDAFADHVFSNIASFHRYVRDPERSSPYSSDDALSTRGSAWAFLRYAADRSGVPETQLWSRLVNTSLTGMANLRNALGTEPLPLFRDWSVSVYTDDLFNTDAAYQQPSWDHRELMNQFLPDDGGYALPIRTLAATPQNVALVSGGSSFLSVATTPAARTNVRFTSGGAAPPATLSVFVVRSR